ncbi:AI-2E family transporter [Blastochloris viridis]|nr:AI-2E family transporter [Blastochloris viridis]
MRRASVAAAEPGDTAPPPGRHHSARAWRRASELAVIVLATIALLGLLYWARALLLPLVAGLVFGMILGPISDRAQRIGISPVVTNLSLLLVLALAVSGAAVWFVPTISEWIADAPNIARTVREKVAVFERAASVFDEIAGLFQGSVTTPTVQIAPEQTAVVTSVFSAVTPAFAQFAVFLFTLVLFLTGRKSIKAKLVLAMPSRAARLTTLRVLSEIENELLGYFAVAATINAGVAIVTTLALFALGVPAAPVWGFLAFVLNFLPVVGPLILKVALLGMGVVAMPTLGAALLPALAYLAITTVESNLITPRVIGGRLTLEPLFLFVAICLFTWLWGPVGAFLATPLVIVAVTLQSYVLPSDAIDLPA